ncbi:MAG: hypothetical protein AAF206_22080, partial [Bacteroidota bacterium]
MKNLLLLLFGACLFSSCATIFNRKTTPIMVYSSEPTTVVCQDETYHSHKNRIKLRVPRSEKDVKLTVIQGEKEQDLFLGSRYSPVFLYNVPTNYGLGMLLDLKNEKAYTYPKSIYIKPRNGGISYGYHGTGNHRGEWNFHLSIPYINHFSYTPNSRTEKNQNTGFWGIRAGLAFYHSPQSYLSISGTRITDFFFPIPAPIDLEGERESLYASFISLTNNHQMGRFSFGYGISYGLNSWSRKYFGYDDAAQEPIFWSEDRSGEVLGLEFPLQVRFNRGFTMGLIYRPTF